MEKLAILRELRQTFHAATGVRLELRPAATPRRNGDGFCVPVIIGDQPVAFLHGRSSRGSGCARLLRLLLRFTAESVEREWIAHDHHEPAWLQSVKQFMEARAGDGVTLAEVARHVKYSPEYLRKQFRPLTGLSFGGYLTQVRVAKAKALLADPQQRITEVAFAAGFQAIPTFNRIFKQQTGQTPTAYRAALSRGGQKPPRAEKRRAASE